MYTNLFCDFFNYEKNLNMKEWQLAVRPGLVKRWQESLEEQYTKYTKK